MIDQSINQHGGAKMAKRFFDSAKFNDPWFRKLSPKMKCLWEYLLCECDHAGIIKFDEDLASFKIGEEVSTIEMLEVFKDRIIQISEEKFFIKKFVLFQYPNGVWGERNSDKSVLKLLKSHGLEDMVKELYANPTSTLDEGLAKGYPTQQVKVQVKVKDKVKVQVKDKGVLGEKSNAQSRKKKPEEFSCLSFEDVTQVVSPEELQKWADTYPHNWLKDEIEHALLWSQEKRKSKRTKGGWVLFLKGWLKRAKPPTQNYRSRPQTFGEIRTQNNREVLAKILMEDVINEKQ